MNKNELRIKFENERYKLSARARSILIVSGIYIFNNFYNMYIERTECVDFKSIRNCEKKTEIELTEFIASILNESKELIPKRQRVNPIAVNSRINMAFEERFDKLQNRAKNVLKKAGADTFTGFYEKILKAKSPDNYILGLRNCGIKTQKEILHFKAEIDLLAFNFTRKTLPQGIFADLRYSFFETSFFNEREQIVVQYYFCIEQNQEHETLEILSKILELTRESVRQISVKVLKKIEEKVKKIIRISDYNLQKYFVQDYFEVETNLTKQINNAEGTNFSPGFISFVMNILCPADYKFVNIGRRRLPDYKGFFVKNTIPFKVRPCYKYMAQQMNLRRKSDIKIETKNIVELFGEHNSSAPFQKAHEINLEEKKQIIGVLHILANNLSDEREQIEVNSEFIVFKRNTKKLKYEYLVEILKEYKRPMHFSELEDECGRRGIEIKSVIGALMHHSKTFGLKGQGTYGLIEWGGYFGSIGDVAEQLLREREEPIFRKELEDILCRELYISQDSIREVLFNYAPEDRFVKLKNDKITLKEWV